MLERSNIKYEKKKTSRLRIRHVIKEKVMLIEAQRNFGRILF